MTETGATRCSGAGSSAEPSVSHHTPSSSAASTARSEEHTCELQSQSNLVCRILLEKKKRRIPRRSGAPAVARQQRSPLLGGACIVAASSLDGPLPARRPVPNQ